MHLLPEKVKVRQFIMNNIPIEIEINANKQTEVF